MSAEVPEIQATEDKNEAAALSVSDPPRDERLERLLTPNPIFLISYSAFIHDLPDLCRIHPRRWVAYHRSSFITSESSQLRAARTIRERNIPIEECAICLVDPNLLNRAEIETEMGMGE